MKHLRMRAGITVVSADGHADNINVAAAIQRLVARARIALFWETLWPRLALLLVVIGAFLTVSWFGLWESVPDWVRLTVVGAFALAAAVSLAATVQLRWPSRVAALARVERESGLNHRPATALSDRLANNPNDAGASALWKAYRKQLLPCVEQLKAGVPSPGLRRRDPLALRFLLVLLFVVSGLYAGVHRGDRVLAAFVGSNRGTSTLALRLDAWATPPAYTDRPPILLTGKSLLPVDTRLTVPQGTVVTVRAGGPGFEVILTGEGTDDPSVIPAKAITPALEGSGTPGSFAAMEFVLKLEKPGTIAVRRGNHLAQSWSFFVQPDRIPEIALTQAPAEMETGALALSYRVKDDYGVMSARAQIERADIGKAAAVEASPLVGPPSFALSLPRIRAREATGATAKNLTDHPWAGLRVRLTLVARDEAGQEGTSSPVELTLPARQFANPIAQALVDARRRLALDAGAAGRVVEELDALTAAPDEHLSRPSDYLNIRAARHALADARTHEALLAVVDRLWVIALALEDGSLAVAKNALAAAQGELHRALEEGATAQKIQRLTEAVRSAAERYLEALAQQGSSDPATAAKRQAQNEARQQDLERMLNEIQQIAKDQATSGAQQLLNRLQGMIENIPPGSTPSTRPGQSTQSGNPDSLGDLMRRQLELMDRTFELSRQPGRAPMSRDRVEQLLRSRREGIPGNQDFGYAPPMTEAQIQDTLRRFTQEQQQRQTTLGGIERDQNDLLKSLGQLTQQLERDGVKLGDDFSTADQSMGQATSDLGRGLANAALADQERALDALRQGADALMRQAAAATQSGQTSKGGAQDGPQTPGEDPLGRPLASVPDLGTHVEVPEEIDLQDARQILEAIRRRLTDPLRPVFERDYLERLLNPY